MRDCRTCEWDRLMILTTEEAKEEISYRICRNCIVGSYYFKKKTIEGEKVLELEEAIGSGERC